MSVPVWDSGRRGSQTRNDAPKEVGAMNVGISLGGLILIIILVILLT